MTTNEDDFRSITGELQSAELAATNNNGHVPTAPSAGPDPTNKAQSPPTTSENGSYAQMRPQALNGSRSLTVSGSPSTANSPLSSRDSSPARPPLRQSGTTAKSGLRSRKSSTDVSPNRGPSLAGSSTTVPSAAAIQRALSSANAPQLQPISVQDPSKVPRPQKPASGTTSGENTSHWPISPRLKSPPPSLDSRSRSRGNSLRSQPRKPESNPSAPSIIVQSSSPASSSRIPSKNEGINSDSEDQAPLTMKGSARGSGSAAPTLETVQEASLPTSPGFEALESQSVTSSAFGGKPSDEERPDVTTAKVTEDLSTRGIKAGESGSDSGPNKFETRGRSQEQRNSSAQRPTIPTKSSYTSLSTFNQRSAAETASKNMTVETETVTSIPQATIGGNQGDRITQGRGDPSGSLRLKPSNETIRPRKDRKKAARKAPSITSGTASSKADIFEAKVASAVDEANSSDSDETFVYESNPPDAQPHRSRNHHSRTPSMTSITSLADPRTAVREAHKVAGKRSMKFVNNPYNNISPDNESRDRPEVTVRGGNVRASGGSSIHHHHIGRHGQGRGGASHISLFDSDSPFPQSSKGRVMSSRHSSGPNSPKYANHNIRSNGNGNGNGNGNVNGYKKNGEFSTYDIDGEGAADDERTPLIGTVRTPRSRNSRRPNSASLRQLEHYEMRRSGGWFRRFAGCLVLSILLLVLVFGAVGLIFATTKPLYGVGVRELQNVICTEQEIMLDILVEAINPNIIGVTVADMDVNVFAKSTHVVSEKWWREHGGLPREGDLPYDLPPLIDRRRHRRSTNESHPLAPASPQSQQAHTADNVDEGTDPVDDPDVDPQTMLLGRIFHFDSPLTFDGSFLKRHPHYSVGEFRLAKPGNKTENGGTERWERVLQYPFELIIRGVLKYQLPLSTRDHTVPIIGKYLYDPSKEKEELKAVMMKVDAGHPLEDEVEEGKRATWGRWDIRNRLRLGR